MKPRRACPTPTLRRLRAAAAACAAALLAACGGGGGDGGIPSADCSVSAQKAWLSDYMDEWYFWYRLSPHPAPEAYPSAEAYLRALLYTGTDPAFPADRWSGSEPSESFNRFFVDGQTLGYGLFVAGIEVTGHPERPLRVRYIEPGSDAAAQGLRRGDELLAFNGRPVGDLIAANDLSALSPAAPGERLQVRLRDAAGAERTVTLQATVYNLTPVSLAAVVQSPAGRRMGYLFVKEMVNQVSVPLDAAFAQFRAAGVRDLVLDLRYNGGGLVSVAAEIASHVAGTRAAGQAFATLLYNDRRAAVNNQSFRFTSPPNAIAPERVYVLTGPRTCSASEQVINGLRPFVDVVLVGGGTCGKPVGFLPQAHCGVTYSVVNYESVNARNEGRYFDGFDATCPVADDLASPLGTPGEALLAAARTHADTGICPATGSAPRAPLGRLREPGDRGGMLVR